MKLFFFVLFFGLVACGRGEFGDTTNAGDVIAPSSDEEGERVAQGGDNAGEANNFSDANNGQAVEDPDPIDNGVDGLNAERATTATLFQHLAQTRRNFVFSPPSLTRSLLTLQAAGSDETKQALGAVLGVEDVTQIETIEFADLSVVGVWVDDTQDVEQQFVDDVATFLDAEVTRLNLDEMETARTTINNTLRDRTDGFATQTLEPAALQEGSVVIAGASYFDALWQTAFEADLSQELPFDNGALKQFIGQRGTFLTSMSAGLQTITIPLDNGNVAIFLMPLDAPLEDLVREFDGDFVQRIIDQQVLGDVIVSIPKIDVETRLTEQDLVAYNLDPSMIDVSNVGAGASLNTWVQYGRLVINEEGIESPATAPPDFDDLGAQNLQFDRPFIFAVVDSETAEVRFAGRVVE